MSSRLLPDVANRRPAPPARDPIWRTPTRPSPKSVCNISVFALVLALFLAAPLTAQENFFQNPGADGPKGWSRYVGASGVTVDVDREQGSARRGSLHIAVGADDGTPHQWRQVCDVSAAKGRRFRLGARVRAQQMKPGAKAVICAQCWNETRQQIGFFATSPITADTEWRDLDVVFDAPEGTRSIFVMAYLINRGEVWWDDFVLEETTRPPTPPPAPGAASGSEARWQKLARGLASDIPWIFDAAAARVRAKDEKRPILVYVRCTDDRAGMPSAFTSLRADDVNFHDDGYMKDLVFRAGVLADRAVSDLVSRRFVPLCVTYHLGVQGRGQRFSFWSKAAGPGARADFDAAAGATASGSMHVANTGEGARAAWSQHVMNGAAETTFRLSARVRSEGLDAASTVAAILTAEPRGGAPTSASTVAMTGSGEWRAMETSLTVPAFAGVAVAFEVTGRGEVWFDDVEVTAGDDPKNLVADGGVDLGDLPDPLATFGASSSETVTPALLVIGKSGEVAHRIHRIGALSSDLVDRWLREALADVAARSQAQRARDLLRDGELDRAFAAVRSKKDQDSARIRAEVLMRRGDLGGAAKFVGKARDTAGRFLRGRIALRRGDWKKAAEHFGAVVEAGGERRDEAGYWLGLCRHRRGLGDQAVAAWREVAGESPYGRKAALALLGGGPRPWMAESVRAWPEHEKLVDRTETTAPRSFDPAKSVRALGEFQRGDGSFTGLRSVWDAAVTAIAVDAFDAWMKKLRGGDREAAAAARDRALVFLEGWSSRRAGRIDSFVAPYVLVVLLRHGREEAARRVVAKILEIQGADGNWSVYGDQRPASFNTAQAVLSLAAAKSGGLEVNDSAFRRGVDALAAMRQDGDLFPYSTAPGHDWMTTDHGAIGRDPLCEHALTVAGRVRKKSTIDAALERFMRYHEELRLPTKKLYDYFNARGHGGYFFFFSHRNALEASEYASSRVRRKLRKEIRDAVLRAREGDGTFMDHYAIGRAYATAMALVILART